MVHGKETRVDGVTGWREVLTQPALFGGGDYVPPPPPPEPEKLTYRRDRKAWRLAYKERRAKLGLCMDCQAKAAPYNRCAAHRAKDAARVLARKKTREPPESAKRRRAVHRADCIRRGVCVECQAPSAPFRRCPKHLADERASKAAKRGAK